MENTVCYGPYGKNRQNPSISPTQVVGDIIISSHLRSKGFETSAIPLFPIFFPIV